MSEEKYICCKYCSKIYNCNDNHVKNCINIDNYSERDGILYCYSCGGRDKQYSKIQLTKKDKARCIDCVTNQNTCRFAHYSHLYQPTHNREIRSINEQLHNHINNLNFSKIKELLEQGANPNSHIQALFFDKNEHNWVYWYNEDGTEKLWSDDHQPTTPLKLCVFRFSDCMLSSDDYNTIIKITRLLIEYGANNIDAINYYISRYEIPREEDRYSILYEVLQNL